MKSLSDVLPTLPSHELAPAPTHSKKGFLFGAAAAPHSFLRLSKVVASELNIGTNIVRQDAATELNPRTSIGRPWVFRLLRQ